MDKNQEPQSGNKMNADAIDEKHDEIETARHSDESSVANNTSLCDISIIENMTSFLEAHGVSQVDHTTLRNMAEALAKSINSTSPGALKDVTMDSSYGVGYRSPCVGMQQYQGNTSPSAPGRTVREFEEQMAALRKENFNLKLRLYFLEESMPSLKQATAAGGDCQEPVFKQLIDAKVEMEVMRKEIQEKQDVLRDAAQAISHMEDMHREAEKNHAKMVEELKEKIHYLEMDRDANKQGSVDSCGSVSILNANNAICNYGNNDFNVRNSASSQVLDENNCCTSECQLMVVSNGIKETNESNLNYAQHINELQEQLKQSDMQVMEFQKQISKLDEILAKRDETIKEYEEKVKECVFQNAELVEALENREKEIANYESSNEMQDQIQKLKSEMADKLCMLQDSEDQLKERNEKYRKVCDKLRKIFESYKKLQEENQKLKNIQSNSTQNTSNSNKENINSESDISDSDMFTRVLNDSSSAEKKRLETIIEQQNTTINNLRSEVKKTNNNLQTLVNKELWEKNREIERLMKLLNQNSASSVVSPPMNDSSHELQQSFSEVEYAKAVKRNHLLQRKVDILIQRLGEDRHNDTVVSQLHKQVYEARTEAENAEKWRRECAEVCAVLANRLEELAGFLNSLLKHKDVLGVLAYERRCAIRKAVDRSLDLSKSLNMTLSISGVSMADQSLAQLSNLSGILGDMEGELHKFANVTTYSSHEDLESIEVLKAENKALKKELSRQRGSDDRKDRRSLPLPISLAADNQSESDAWSEPDRKVSMARIGLEDVSLNTKEMLVAAQLHAVETDSETDALTQSRANTSGSSKARNALQERITQLEAAVTQRDQRILHIQCQLVDADNRLTKESLRVRELTSELNELRMHNTQLMADLNAIGTQESTSDREDLKKNVEILRQIEQKTNALEKIKEERDRLRVESQYMEMEVKTLKEEVADTESKYQKALKLAGEEEELKLSELRQELESIMHQRLKDQESKFKDALTRDWIARNIYDECKQQLLELQRQYTESQRSIDMLMENEQELKQTILENEHTARALKRQLDESTLQASKTVMERTKALNDKLKLEKLYQDLKLQLTAQETERLSLQRMVTELEEFKLQTEKAAEKAAENQKQNRSNNNISDGSGYTSEDVPQIRNKAANVSASQRVNNNSPDLGIESDGRVSSVELSNTQHAKLKIVELAAAVENNPNIKKESDTGEQSATSGTSGIHDCAKVEQENAELRRKLIRTKRAFEDTYEKLRVANQRKAQIEKDIKNQILKTQNVLQNVRSNMENEKM